MKNLSFALGTAALLLFSPSLSALAEEAKAAAGQSQTPRGKGRAGQMDPDARANAMKESLGLSDEQTVKVKAVLEKSRDANREKLEALQKDKNISREDRRKQQREILGATMKEVHGILTPEQQDKWKAQRQKRRAEAGRTGKTK